MIHTLNNDTIAAVSTALTNSGIGIIRISGDRAVETADRIFRKPNGRKLKDEKTFTIHYGHIYDGDQMIDEVLVMLMRGPKSYTAEDTVEIDCHGGVLVMKKVLETVIKNGARPAEPGEFTKRAFLNGRIDLSQAEAVIDVINAKNDYALKSSVSQLNGAMSKKIKKLREELIYEIAFIESALDDPEHISLDGYPEQLRGRLAPVKSELRRLLASADNGRVVKEGVKTVILGKPNAGKSSLMNVLVGEERAIVTDVEGTTRDILEEHIRFHGISLNIVDTAGIRETDDIVERIGVDRARHTADEADLIIYVVDGSRPLDENDREIIELIRGIPVSAKEQKGIDALEEQIKEMFLSGDIDFNDEVMITNIRHKAALKEALDSLELVERSIDDGMPEDFFSIDLMNAYEQLGTIIGEALEDDLVNEIFSRFCMGK